MTEGEVGAVDSDARVTVVIVNWNTRDLLGQCLQSVAEASILRAGLAEMIVVDNASTDGSADAVRHGFPSVRLMENKQNVGFAVANNQAIGEARGEYLILLNSDTEVCGRALETLTEFMDAHPRAAACGARLINADGTLQPSAQPMLTPERELWRLTFLDRVLPYATYPMRRWDTHTPRQVSVIKGACLMLRRTALEQVGPLDDAYFMYTEEVDLCYRLAHAGWELWWVPEAEVIHYGEASSRQMRDEMYLQLYRSKVQFYRKFGGRPRAARFKLYLALTYAPRMLGTAAIGLLAPQLRARGRLYRRVLAAIPRM